MNVLDDYMVDPRLSLLDKTRIQAQVLVPVLRALRTELGKERADTIADKPCATGRSNCSPRGRKRRGQPAAQMGGHADRADRNHRTRSDGGDEQARQGSAGIRCHACRFAEFFRALGEPELGALLVCATDFDIVAAGGSEVGLTRDQTLMQGAPSCTFRYRFCRARKRRCATPQKSRERRP